MATKSNTSRPAVPGAASTGRIVKEDVMASIFVSGDSYKAPEGSIVKTMSPLLKPSNFPIGKVLVGRFVKIFETRPAADKVGEGVEIVPDGASVGVALPVVATLRTGLEISGTGKMATSPHMGNLVAIRLFPDKIPSKKGQDAWNFVVIIYPKEKPAIRS